MQFLTSPSDKEEEEEKKKKKKYFGCFVTFCFSTFTMSFCVTRSLLVMTTL